MTITKERFIGEIVAEDYRTAQIFKKHNIDFCCKGNRNTPPADACNTYRLTFALLNEFEEYLHLHIHLENNILFPKAIEMEKEFRT